ncbi:hypothetical protein ACS3SW_20645 [Roseobacteraceae bacterium S113]
MRIALSLPIFGITILAASSALALVVAPVPQNDGATGTPHDNGCAPQLVQLKPSWDAYYKCVDDCMWVKSGYGQYATSISDQWECNSRCSNLRPK